MGMEVKSMLHVFRSGMKDTERFLSKITVKLPCFKCHGTGCAVCSGYGYTREIINKNRIIEV
jgi:hypothetical protein